VLKDRAKPMNFACEAALGGSEFFNEQLVRGGSQDRFGWFSGWTVEFGSDNQAAEFTKNVV
jgi:hypothetical protein